VPATGCVSCSAFALLRPVASSVLLQPNVSNGLLDIAEDLEVPEACGWLLIGTDPMGILVDADGFFGHTLGLGFRV
jgi:hypothetical protein